MARLVVELDGLLKMVMGAGKFAELKASAAANAVRDQGLGTIRPGRGFAQKKLRDFAHRCRFAATQMPAPKTVIGGEPFRGVFHPVMRTKQMVPATSSVAPAQRGPRAANAR